jgi:hypothetical protein
MIQAQASPSPRSSAYLSALAQEIEKTLKRVRSLRSLIFFYPFAC